MALNGTYMRALIRENGHLVLTGLETPAELREALRNLQAHTHEKCQRPELGAPIASLLPNPDALAAKPMLRRNVINVDLSSGSL